MSAEDSLNVGPLIEFRASLAEQLESIQGEIDRRLMPSLVAFFDTKRDLGQHLHCAPEDYHFDYASPVYYVFSHNCQDHGYDLPDTESVEMPREFVEHPGKWTRGAKAVADAKNAQAAARRRTALLAELETLEGQMEKTAER